MSGRLYLDDIVVQRSRMWWDFVNKIRLPDELLALLSKKLELIRVTKGFMPPNEGKALAASLYQCDAPIDLPAIEIGSYAGLSTIYLGTAAKQRGRAILSVDHHWGSEENQAGWEFHDPGLVDPVSNKMDTLYLFRRTLELAELSDTVIVIAADSKRYACAHSGAIGYLFIDGGHSIEQAEADYESWVPKLVRGGYLAIHDVFPDPAMGGQAPFAIYQRALATGFTEISSEGSLRVMRRDSK